MKNPRVINLVGGLPERRQGGEHTHTKRHFLSLLLGKEKEEEKEAKEKEEGEKKFHQVTNSCENLSIEPSERRKRERGPKSGEWRCGKERDNFGRQPVERGLYFPLVVIAFDSQFRIGQKTRKTQVRDL